MTILAGFNHKGRGYIACDLAASNSWTKTMGPVKIQRISANVLAGYSGSYVHYRFLRRILPGHLNDLIEAEKGNTDDFLDLIQDLWLSWTSRLREEGHGKTDDSDGELILPGNVLIVTRRQLLDCGRSGTVIPYTQYAAQGSGRPIALGAFHSLTSPDLIDTLDGYSLIESVIEAAVCHNPYCDGEAQVLETKDVYTVH